MITELINQLNNDPGYRMAWKANIAMAFKNQAHWDKREWDKEQLHETANKAAEHFLWLLTKLSEEKQLEVSDE